MPIYRVVDREVRRHGKRYQQTTVYQTGNALPGVVAAAERLEAVLSKKPQDLSPFDTRMVAWEQKRNRAVGTLIDLAAIAEQCNDIAHSEMSLLNEAALVAQRTGDCRHLNGVVRDLSPDASVVQHEQERRQRVARAYLAAAAVVQGGGRIA